MMKPCRNIERELAAFGTGDLSPAEQDRVEAHLDACADCRAELAREMSLRHTLGSLPVVSAPRDLDSRILAEVRRNLARPVWKRPRIRGTAAAGLAAACLALVFLWPSVSRPPAPKAAWTQEEIAAARQEVAYTLTLAAEVINRSQRETMVDVFADKLPNAINESFRKIKLTNPGGKG